MGSRRAHVFALTEREREVQTLRELGLTRRQIAEQLSLSMQTVRVIESVVREKVACGDEES